MTVSSRTLQHMTPSCQFPARSKISRAAISTATRHAFLCTGPDCCDPSTHAGLWELLKAETKNLDVPVLRTKAACLRICTEGPWLVVYPDGIWYGQLTPERLHRIIREHLGAGRPVEEWIATDMPGLGKNSPLPGGALTSGEVPENRFLRPNP